MNCYQGITVTGREDFEEKRLEAPRFFIECFPWGCENPPESSGVLGWDGANIHVFLQSAEQTLRAEVQSQNGPLYTDSCLEFYLQPAPEKSSLYFNFEVNPLGVMFISIGNQRQDRTLIFEETPAYFQMRALKTLPERSAAGWDISYTIPTLFIQKYIPLFETEDIHAMRGNFYKCGNLLPKPHWGCWNPVTTEKPDFHRPDYFGSIAL